MAAFAVNAEFAMQKKNAGKDELGKEGLPKSPTAPYRTRFSTRSCQSVGAKRLFATRPGRSSTILAIEDNSAKPTHCV